MLDFLAKFFGCGKGDAAGIAMFLCVLFLPIFVFFSGYCAGILLGVQPSLILILNEYILKIN